MHPYYYCTSTYIVVLSGDYCAVVTVTQTQSTCQAAFLLTIVLDTTQVLEVLGVGGSEVFGG